MEVIKINFNFDYCHNYSDTLRLFGRDNLGRIKRDFGWKKLKDLKTNYYQLKNISDIVILLKDNNTHRFDLYLDKAGKFKHKIDLVLNFCVDNTANNTLFIIPKLCIHFKKNMLVGWMPINRGLKKY